MADFLFKPVPHEDAVDFIASKPVVSRSVFEGLLPELRARAFTITGVDAAAAVQSVRDRIADLPAGSTWDAVKQDVARQISVHFVDPAADPEERDKQVNASNRRAELLLRTHGFQAYQTASYQRMSDQKDVLPYWQYVSMGDGRVRPSHAALNGVVVPANSPFWLTHFPPWDYGCRCQAVPLSKEDHDDIKAADASKAPDQQRILEGPALKALELDNRLARGPNQIANVSPPTGPYAYHWHPGDRDFGVADLRARYDADVFGDFKEWAEKTELRPNDKRTVWGWLNGERTNPKPPPPPPWNPVIFADATAALQWAEAHMSPDGLPLTRDQRAALADYQGTAYAGINTALRSGGSLSSATAREVAVLDAAISLSETPAALTVYRGLDTAQVHQVEVGMGFEEQGFMSTSLVKEVAEHDFSVGAVLEIRLPAGSNAVYMDGLDPTMSSEIEMLLGRGTLLRCINKEMRGTILWLTMEVI